MRILTVPNWSFGRNRALLQEFDKLLAASPVTVHYLGADADHNRCVSAFSGEADGVHSTLMLLADLAFAAIDLNRHVGVHPRIGALDVCPFVLLPSEADGGDRAWWEQEALVVASLFAEELANAFKIPVYLYEKSEHGRHEADLPSLRRGGFGGLAERTLTPDYGPPPADERLGVSVVGVRDFLIAMNVNLALEDAATAQSLARQIRDLRTNGDPRFLGVRALGFSLASRAQSQVSLNLTLPDLTPVDPIVEWVREAARDRRIAVAGTELIGVIRPKDVAKATELRIRPEQVVE